MKPITIPVPTGIELRWIPAIKGWGVFARRAFRRGQTIEICLVLPFRSRAEERKAAATILVEYGFRWDPAGAIAWGWGSLYNHSFKNNATYEADTRRKLLVFKATRPIKPGEEIRTDYTKGRPERIWFKVKEDYPTPRGKKKN